MATKTQIKNYIKDRVYTNTRQAITGNSLQETLCKVVDDLELGSSTGGVEKNYVDSQDKMTLDEAKKYTDAKVAGGGEALLTWRYSAVESKDAPLDPDKAPDLWHAAPQTSDDHWAALKETGGSWNIWPLTAKDGKTKPSIVTYKGVWKNDGLYTGTETDDSVIVDIVYFTSAGAVDGKYYMAIQTKKFVNESTPQPDTDEGKAYWSAFQGQYANIATDFLFSQQVVSNLIQAINLNATKTNADKINTDDLVAKKVRTSETGERITIQDNRFEAKDSNNKIVNVIDPSKTISYDYYSANAYKLEVDSGTTFFTRRTTQGTVSSLTNVYTVGTFIIGPSGQYLYDLLCNNLIIRASSSSNAADTYPEMQSVNNFSVTVNAKIGSRNYTLASGSVQINGPVYQVKQVPLIFNKIGNLYYAGTTGCTISISVTHSYSQPSSYSAYINQANVSFDAGATFGVYVNPSIFIGKNMASFGTLTESNHCLIGGSGNTVLDILTSNSGITVTQNSVNVITDKIRGLVPIVNPYVYTHSGRISSGDTAYGVDTDSIEIMYALHKNSVPVYCNVTYNYATVPNAAYTVSVMAKLEAAMAKSSSTGGYMDTTLFFAAHLHDMRQGFFDSDTGHIINIFITGKTRTDNSLPLYSSGSLKCYIHTI